jgi:hypothetical protein
MTLSLLFVQVTLIKSTLLDLKILGERPTLHDLPVSPLFGIVTGLCSVPSQNQGNKCYFTLSRKTYNPFNGTYVTMDIPCFYELENGRHSSVANTTNGKAVFSTASDFDALKVDRNVINEYKRLKQLNQMVLKEMNQR